MTEMIDAAGTAHQPAPAARIVSLVPSVTELLFDLGLAGQVVGRTAFCVRPAGRVKSARSVGGTKTVNLQKLLALRPTHVVVNIDETPRELARQLEGEGLVVVVTHPLSLQDNPPLFRLLGHVFDRREAAEALCGRFEAALAEARTALAGLPRRPVLYLIWKDPWMTVSRETYIARSLSFAGLDTWPAVADRRYPTVELDHDLLRSVHHVLFSTEPFPFTERHLAEFGERHPEHAGKATLIDGQMVSWYGSRAIEALGELARFRRTLR